MDQIIPMKARNGVVSKLPALRSSARTGDSRGSKCKTRPNKPERSSESMIHSLTIDGYRGFSHFEMPGLRRINLLVGRNNGGKTSVLEMLNLLVSGGDPGALFRIVSRRGERVYTDQPSSRPEGEYEISHLFHGHNLNPGAHFSVSAKNQHPPRSVRCAFSEPSKEDQHRLLSEGGEAPNIPPYVLELSGNPKPPVAVIPLTRRASLRGEILDPIRRRHRTAFWDAGFTHFISTESLTFDTLAAMWNQIALTEAQSRVLQALRSIEPKVEAIAPLITAEPYYFYGGRGGFIVKLAEITNPIPIGSFGDGTWRILALSIALSRAKDGVLMVDEIDTGLHYSVMESMWKLVAETSRTQNIQVFATAHSYDCVNSLAAICDKNIEREDLVTIQRIDARERKAVPYYEDEMKIAATRHIEMR